MIFYKKRQKKVSIHVLTFSVPFFYSIFLFGAMFSNKNRQLPG